MSKSTIPSLMFLCRTVVTINLERYTPESFQICDVYEWQEIVRLRHSMTQPRNHNTTNNHNHSTTSYNDIDGNGRLLPAISAKVLLLIEECNTHLADCSIADTMVWKDCVEYRFKRNVGLLRPPTLFVPWPILVQDLQRHAHDLTSIMCTGSNDDTTGTGSSFSMQQSTGQEKINEAITILQSTTWNVALLRDTGIGKIVKRIIKKQRPSFVTEKHINELQQLLSGWMELATKNNNGTFRWQNVHLSESGGDNRHMKPSPPPPPPSIHTVAATDADDLQLLEKCLSWRQLYQALEDRKAVIQATQGKRMREIRDNVEKHRPKLVKVRPTAKTKQLQSKADPFVSGDSAVSTSNQNNKVAMLRNEAIVQTGRLQMNRPTKPSFGDAVAFAAVTKKGMAHKRKMIGGTIQQLQNGKRMKVPSSMSSTTGTMKVCPSRQFASKFKSSPVAKKSNRKKA